MIRTTAALAMLALTWPALAGAQAKPAPAPRPVLARWVEVQNATLNLRYRFIDTSAGVVTTNQVQHRESLRAKVKFDPAGRYGLVAGVFSGSRFTSGWNNTGVGLGDWQDTLAVRALHFVAQPAAGVEAQYGSLFIIKGESTEITTYDEDGYVLGERLSVRRPRDLFFDEISATVGYLTGSPSEYGISRRVKYLNDRPNYGHYLVDKKFGRRAGVSLDFTSASDARTWRAAASLRTPELGAIDSILFENYRRTSPNAAYGFAITLDKALSRKLSMNGGVADIDRSFGGLNADRFHIGQRAFVMAVVSITPTLSASAFITRAFGKNPALPQRTLSNIIFSYNALPHLRRTGLL